MLNGRGGIETDITVNRLREDAYIVISSATTHARDRNWIEKNLSETYRTTLTDVTSAYAVLSIQGPKSRQLLGKVTDADLANDAFPFATSREIDIGYARVIANRLTFVGELGWELHIPTEFAPEVCKLILDAGVEFDLKPAGYHALEHLRSECAYREYQLDLTPDDTPFEAGLAFTVKMDKPGGFIGRDSLLKQLESPLTKKLVMFRLRDSEALLFHDELIRLNSEIVGYISSGAYGFTLGSSVGMGYVHWRDGVSKDLIESGDFEIEIAGDLYPAAASQMAFYDPRRQRVRM
jgi:4-methylaminobutanoate oxidase (formaldehyde-forming)